VHAGGHQVQEELNADLKNRPLGKQVPTGQRSALSCFVVAPNHSMQDRRGCNSSIALHRCVSMLPIQQHAGITSDPYTACSFAKHASNECIAIDPIRIFAFSYSFVLRFVLSMRSFPDSRQLSWVFADGASQRASCSCPT
jgi:hypothetical protein